VDEQDQCDLEERTRARLQHLRLQRGLPLARVAAAAKMDTSTLSRLEAGTRRLTLAHIVRLATALGVETDALLSDAGTGAAATEPAPAAVDGRRWRPLTDESPEGARAYHVTFTPGPFAPPPSGHRGHLWIYVLRGRLRLVLGTNDQTFGPGTAIAFSTAAAHRLGAVDEDVEVLAVFDPSGSPIRTVVPDPLARRTGVFPPGPPVQPLT
jgi:transcriptional regulator with XRE-family HTH domain